MKRLLGVVLLLVVMSGSVFAADVQSYNAVYQIAEGIALVQAQLSFTDSVTAYDLILPGDASDIDIEGKYYSLVPTGNAVVALIRDEPFSELSVTYKTSSVVEETSDGYFILPTKELPGEQKSIKLELPEGVPLRYALNSERQSVYPQGAMVGTDGRKIEISWSDELLKDDPAILVIYDVENFGWYYVAGGVALLFVAGYLLFVLKRKKGSKSDYTKNLFEEEKDVVQILLKAPDHELWQKELQRKAGITKVKLSRKIRSLEQKGLIEKIPYGNTNKIRLRGIS